jgi:hypothetical protein
MGYAMFNVAVEYYLARDLEDIKTKDNVHSFARAEGGRMTIFQIMDE